MQEVLIRGIDFESTEEIHDYIAEELSFPSYYGKNLDALYDVLTDLSRETRIRIDLTDTENEEIRDYLLPGLSQVFVTNRDLFLMQIKIKFQDRLKITDTGFSYHISYPASESTFKARSKFSSLTRM